MPRKAKSSMSNKQKKKARERRANQRSQQPQAEPEPQVESVEDQFDKIYKEISSKVSRDGSDVEEHAKRFGEATAGLGIDFQIVKHKNLIKGKEKEMERCMKGLALAELFSCAMSDEDKIEMMKRGKIREKEIQGWIIHSELMIDIFELIKSKDIPNLEKKIDAMKEHLVVIDENLSDMVSIGYTTEREYIGLMKLFKDEFETWSDVMKAVKIGIPLTF